MIMLYIYRETTEEKHLLTRLFIYLFNQVISEQQCIIMNMTVNMPESAKRLVFICSTGRGVKLSGRRHGKQ